MVIKHKPHLTQQAHSLIQEHFLSLKIEPKTAIDATCGNGFDTVFLAKLVSDTVYAFDIQEIALNNTQEKLQVNHLDNKVKLIKSGHENLSIHIKHPCDIIMFNFGYLPQADKSVTTMTETSIEAIESALTLLTSSGILSLLCYPGHFEGKKEASAINKFVDSISKQFCVRKYQSHFQNSKSPILYLLSNTKPLPRN